MDRTAPSAARKDTGPQMKLIHLTDIHMTPMGEDRHGLSPNPPSGCVLVALRRKA